ncbi:MAG TPA: Rv1355c family protein [Sandaracinaceae bacterium LLY-WYZ-13_1]|nr:Rv1355c family protein [Sandaracinaceae bacterium LLY-WYZ-13_1]
MACERSPFRPEILREDAPSDGPRIEELLSSPGIAAHRRAAALRAELEGLVPPPDADLREEAPRWVFFPWRRTMVELLGPRAFDRLRLDRNRNKITSEEQSRLRRLTVAIIGLSVGSASAQALAREGLCGHLVLADFDAVELSNLNRAAATVLDLGENKAVTAARHVAEVDPYLPVTVEPAGIRGDDLDRFLEGVDLVVEECDSFDAKVAVRLAARERRVPVFMETSDRGLLDVERFDSAPHRPIFHGLAEGLHPEALSGLSTEEKVPYLLRILEARELSSRSAASLVEIGETITTWPQLASDVSLGASLLAAAIRRWTLEPTSLPSGRVRVDLDEQLGSLAQPPVPRAEIRRAATSRGPLPTGLEDALLEAARLAPSGGNAQPWRLRARADGLDVYLDRSKTSRMDVEHRGSLVAIGAALLNARVVAGARHRLGAVRILPEGDASDLVGCVDLGRHGGEPHVELARQVPRRVSNRRHGDGRPLEADLARRLADEVSAEGARLVWLTGHDLRAAIPLWAESDRLRFLTEALHREMMSELRVPGVDDLRSGLDVRALELTASGEAKLDIARRPDVMRELRAWGGGARLGEDTRDRLASASGVALVVIPSKSAAAYVRGGMAVERLWLRAQAAGLAVHPMSPTFLYAQSEAEARQVAGPEHGAALMALRRRLSGLACLAPDEALALSLRVSHAPPPRAVSLRER